MADVVRAGGEVVELVAARTFRRSTREPPAAGPGEAVVAPRAVGICGTDLHAWRGRYERLPVVLTHDGVADVAAVGPGVDPRLVGARVVVDPVVACGTCDRCRQRHPGTCAKGGYLGIWTDGLLAERVAVPAGQLVAIPPEVDDLDGTVLEPVAVGCRIADQLAALGSPRGCAVVIGGGPVGLLIGLVLGDRGWDVHVVEPVVKRREFCTQSGLWGHTPQEVARIGEAHVVVETSATTGGTALAVEAAGPGSTMFVVGRSPGAIGSTDILLGELTCAGIRGGSGYYPEAVDLVAHHRLIPRGLVSDVFDVHDVDGAFGMYDDPDPPIRTVLRFHRGLG